MRTALWGSPPRTLRMAYVLSRTLSESPCRGQSDRPPSTEIDAPVTNAPRSVLIQSTASAISSGLPSRPNAARSIASPLICSAMR